MGAKTGVAPRIRQLALRNPELTNSDIARAVGCKPSNVTGVLKTFLNGRDEAELRDFQSNRCDIIDAVSQNILESLTPSKIAKGSALQLVTAFGILHDKSQVLRGQATGIDVVAILGLAQVIKENRTERVVSSIDATVS